MTQPHILYCWGFELADQAVGHISLNVWDPERNDHSYTSHWPKYGASLKSGGEEPTNPESLVDDIEAEGNRKPEIVEIPFDFLDPKKTIQGRIANQEKLYNMTTWNCAHVVCAALQDGLTNPKLQEELKKGFVSQKIKIPLFPKQLFSWVKNNLKGETDKRVNYFRKQRPLPDSEAPSTHLYPCAPLKPTDNFSGRSAHLLSVCEALKSPDKKKALVVTAGIGGVGKTEFSRKVAQELSNVFEGRIFWMDSETEESLQKCLVDFSTHLKIPHDFKSETMSMMSKEEIKKLFLRIYSHFAAKGQKSLFIFDNANTFKSTSTSKSFFKGRKTIFLISDFLPNSFPPTTFSPCPAILITSRSSDWSDSKDFQMINLQNFTLEETIEYFKKSFPDVSEDQMKECEPEIELLHQRFDGYTLAFTLALGWIRGSGHSRKLKEGLKCYLQLFQRASNNLHKKDRNSTSSSWDTNYKFDPHEIMEQTCAAIERENPLALKLLKQMSFLSPDFLSVEDCRLLNKECFDSDFESALETLAKFNVVKDFQVEGEQLFDENIQIHRVTQQLVRESQTRSKDVSIPFEMCDALLINGAFTPVPHLKSLVGHLEDFEGTLSFWFLIKKPKCKKYMAELRLKIKKLQRDDDLSLKVIDLKLENLHSLIQPESVMDNSDFLDDSNQLQKINYQELADFVLLNIWKSEGDDNKFNLSILRRLQSFGIWPKRPLDDTLLWLRSQTGTCEVKRAVVSHYLQNPRTTPEQRQELESIQSELDLNYKYKECFTTDQNAQNWIHILQHQRTLDGLPLLLPKDDKIQVMEHGIHAFLPFSGLEDSSLYALFLSAVEENCQKVDEDGGNKMASKLLKNLPRDDFRFMISKRGFARFTEIVVLLFHLSQSFSLDDLDDFVRALEVRVHSVGVGYFSCFITTISALSAVQREGSVRERIHSYFERVWGAWQGSSLDNLSSWRWKEQKAILNAFLPYLISFVEQNKDSKDENAKDLAKVIQSFIDRL